VEGVVQEPAAWASLNFPKRFSFKPVDVPRIRKERRQRTNLALGMKIVL